MIPIPPSKPRASREVVVAAAKKRWQMDHPGMQLPSLFVLAVRAYYRDSMGIPRSNDYSMFDDAFFIVSPDGMTSWNGNSDPSRIGWNKNADKFMARRKPGCWKFRSLKHHPSRPNGYMAFGQGASPVTVDRLRSDGSIAVTESGLFGINLHRASMSGTSSEGCPTVPLSQWAEFRDDLNRVSGKKEFDLILTEGPIV